MEESTVIEAINEGHATAAEIADYDEVSPSTARRYLKKLAQDEQSRITRERDGGSYVYLLQDDTAESDAAEMPVFGGRDYDWGELVPPPSDAEYVEVDGEKSDIDALIDSRESTGQLPRFRLTGPPGTGKTTLARTIAAERGWPCITIQFTASMRDSQLIGSPHLIGGESVWVDGPEVKALLCSQERPVVVILDEVNRAPFHRKSSLQPFLDHRAQTTIELRGGETIEGDPSNLVTVATMNEGTQYETFRIDPAERRRHGNTYEVPYLGLQDAQREINMVAEKTPLDSDTARVYVRAANEVRKDAIEDELSVIETGLATSTVLEWARTTAAYAQAGRPNPGVRAVESSVIDAHYTDEREANEVRAILVDSLQRAGASGGVLA